MAKYQLILNSDVILRRDDNAFIPNDPANKDRYEYELWLIEGNVPDQPDEIPQIVIEPSNEPHYSPEEELSLRQEQTK